MRIRRESAALGKFLTEMLQVMLIKASLEKRACVVARRRVHLEINQVCWTSGDVSPAEKMVKPNFIQSCGRSVSGNMSAKTRVFAIGVHHHCHRVPARQALDASFQFAIARVLWFLFR